MNDYYIPVPVLRFAYRTVMHSLQGKRRQSGNKHNLSASSLVSRDTGIE